MGTTILQPVIIICHIGLTEENFQMTQSIDCYYY